MYLFDVDSSIKSGLDQTYRRFLSISFDRPSMLSLPQLVDSDL
jgi:hypothetical protein